MVKCYECKRELAENERYYYKYGYLLMKIYCKDCYKKRIDMENKHWNLILSEGHL